MSKHWITKDQYRLAMVKAEKAFATFLKMDEEDFWIGLEVEGEYYDLNLFNGDDSAYCTIFPTVMWSDDGLKRKTVTTEYIRMITLERHSYE